MFCSLWVTHPPVMGFDFTVITPLLLSHCGFSFVFECGVPFLVSSSVFLLMIVQQLVVILMFSQEGVRARPSTPPSWFFSLVNLHLHCIFNCLIFVCFSVIDFLDIHPLKIYYNFSDNWNEILLLRHKGHLSKIVCFQFFWN